MSSMRSRLLKVSVVPAGSFDLEDTDATGNGKGTPQDEHKSMNDPSMSPKGVSNAYFISRP
jgi:hypothetical protein